LIFCPDNGRLDVIVNGYDHATERT
jgi:hypothetical protein